MADTFRTVKSNGTGDHTTINAAITAVIAAQGATPFDANERVQIFELGVNYTDIGVLPSTLQPTSTNRINFEGIDGSSGQARWVRPTGVGANLTVDCPNWSLLNLNVEKDGTATAHSAIFIGSSADASGGRVDLCKMNGVDSSTDIVFLFGGDGFGGSGFSSDLQVKRSTFNTTLCNPIRLEDDDCLVESCQIFDVEFGLSNNLTVGIDNTRFYGNSVLMRSGAAGAGIFITPGSTNTDIRGNIFKDGDNSVLLNTTDTGLVLDFNLVNGATDDFKDSSDSTDYTLAAWQAAFGSLSQSSINGDPLFVNETSGSEDLHIQDGSAAENAGVAIAGFDFDFDGDPRGSPPDIGMDELSAVVSPIVPTGASPASLSLIEHVAENLDGKRGLAYGRDGANFRQFTTKTDGTVEIS